MNIFAFSIFPLGVPTLKMKDQFCPHRTQHLYPNTLVVFFPNSLRASKRFPFSLLGSLVLSLGGQAAVSVSNINTRWSPHSKGFIALEMFSVTCFKTESHEIRLSIFLLFPKTHFSARVSMAHFSPWQYRIDPIPSDHSPGRTERLT